MDSKSANKSVISIIGEGKRLSVNDTFLSHVKNNWLDATLTITTPLKRWNVKQHITLTNLCDGSLPVLFGSNAIEDEYLQRDQNNIYLELDIFGSAFFMLTRYEEALCKTKDSHSRFPSDQAISIKENIIHRPIINEYIEVLWACINELWPLLDRRERTFSIQPTHDVDAPYERRLLTLSGTLKRSIKDITIRKSYALAIKTLLNSVWARYKDLSVDPYFTFDAIMGLSEKLGLTSHFYFITNRSSGLLDGDYDIDDSEIKALINTINKRGHYVGLHPSYHSLANREQLQFEFERLRQACTHLNQKEFGGRQHYLRWDAKNTFSDWDNVGLSYDSSLSYPEVAGFRAGICYEYSTYDLLNRTKLNLKEIPLIVMESSVIDKQYMGLGTGEPALEYILLLKKTCQKFNGNFCILWHNHRLIKKNELTLYTKVLSQ
ncbi:polysaccharide deacetylase family protein [Alkalimarinus alittae]|uniref:Polysaccharide deacetylase family protein n=1 Tax=Alkalimarinus alittae TaxID=2961619 RepID=A0ABY6MZ97_9ALTE|nr:polysaccharide deacetylase family protein [Alkalimarinus alittae]UZE95158.1 polysaccharide deacetylase family protein [Alkalimarinus alittae]